MYRIRKLFVCWSFVRYWRASAAAPSNCSAPLDLRDIVDSVVQADALQDRPRGGLGINLALVRSIVELPLTPNAAFG